MKDAGEMGELLMLAWNVQTCDGGSHKRKDRKNGGLYVTEADVCLTIGTMQPRECLVVRVEI